MNTMRFPGVLAVGLSVAVLTGTAEAGWLDAINKAVDTVNRVTNAVEAVKEVPNGRQPASSAPAVAPAPAVAQTSAATPATAEKVERTEPKEESAAPVKVPSRLALSEEEADDIANGQPISMDMDDLAARMKASSDYVLIDVRKPMEFKSGHIRGAKNIPFDDVSNSMPKPCSDKDKPIYLYCLSGDRAIAAGQYLIKNGYTRVYNCGGIDDWNGKLIKGK